MIVIAGLAVRWRDSQSDIVLDLRRFTKSMGIVNLREVRKYLSKTWNLDPCEVAEILHEAVKRGALRPARPLWQCWYAPERQKEANS